MTSFKKRRSPRTRSPAQQWASRRNGAKFRIRGMINNLESLQKERILTRVEMQEVDEAVMFLMDALLGWEYRNRESRKEFLKPNI